MPSRGFSLSGVVLVAVIKNPDFPWFTTLLYGRLSSAFRTKPYPKLHNSIFKQIYNNMMMVSTPLKITTLLVVCDKSNLLLCLANHKLLTVLQFKQIFHTWLSIWQNEIITNSRRQTVLKLHNMVISFHKSSMQAYSNKSEQFQ